MFSEEEGGNGEDREVELFHITKNDCRDATEEGQKLLSFFSLL